MAFHVACPITCRRICFCLLGFPRELQREKANDEFLERVGRVEEFLKDPWLLKVKDERTVQVAVPKVVAPPLGDGAGGGCGGGIDGEEMLSAQTKRAAMQRKAAAASLVAEDFARRFESGDLLDATGDLPGQEEGQSNVKVMCRLCFFGENEGSERARKMLSCKSCGKKYHRSCLKAWAQHRDLFHWSSWTCPTCRICEVCRRTGDPNKFMFCKRCDGAYHCYCQQPPHKNVGSGPYLCPKHTICHSCGSTVSGNGLSTRWFLGYTCCDACGRLFVKGNYCPVCLKVYRDSEATPMVCCDSCQRWVHCQCDGISDEKYLQFQVDGNLQYVCATCRGECYKVQDLEDAVQELWRRRDQADQDLIASLRAAAGLPTQEEIFSISPFSDDEENDSLMLKNEYSRSLKFSLKGLVDKSPKKAKEYGKKSTNKKSAKKGYQRSSINKTEAHQSFEGHSDTPSFGHSGAGDNNDDMLFHRSERPFPSHTAGSLTEGICSMNQVGVLKHRFIDEVAVSIDNAKSKVKSSKPHGLDSGDDTGKNASISMTTKGPKLVIHLGGRNRNATNSPGSDASSYQREQDLTTFNGSEDMGEQRIMDKHLQDRNDASAELGNSKGNKVDFSDQLKGLKFGRERNSLKIRKISLEDHDVKPKFGGGNVADGHEAASPVTSCVPLGKRSIEGSRASVGTVNEVPARRGEKVYLRKYDKDRPDVHGDINDNGLTPSVSRSLPKDSKPLLKLKFKNPYHESQSSWTPNGEDDKSSIKGQRSKRKRSSPFMEKKSIKEDEDFSKWYGDGTMEAIMDANWILQKLGQDAIGKRVEVHQPSDNSWHKGTVTDITEGTPFVSVALDDGKDKNLELGKQGIRFVSQKQKR